MELKEIKELIKLVAESGVSEVGVERGDFKISIKKIEDKIVKSILSKKPKRATKHRIYRNI